MLRALRQWCRRSRGRSGTAALEFALVAPVLLFLLAAMVDVTRFVMATLRVHRVAASISDVGAQFQQLRDGMQVVRGDEVGILFLAAGEIGGDLDVLDRGTVIVTLVADIADGDGARIRWQRRSRPDGARSSLGEVPGGVPTLPDGFTVGLRETALFSEVAYPFRPYLFSAGFMGTDPSVTVSARSVHRPRFGTLLTLEP
jgi:hypothetical protein